MKRVAEINNRICKLQNKISELAANPGTFSYNCAFGNPGGLMSKSLARRVESYHRKLLDLHNQVTILSLHRKILMGDIPLAEKDKRDYILAHYHYGVYFGSELDAHFLHCLSLAPSYVRKAYGLTERRNDEEGL